MTYLEPSRTVADVITEIEADHGLSDVRRRDLISALRTACRFFGADPAEIPADPRTLRARFESVSAPLIGIGTGRLRNVRCLTLAALRHVGIKAIPGRFRILLLPAWADLRARLPDIRTRHGLSRFLGYCSFFKIEPHDLDLAVFERFGHCLETESLVRRPHQVHRDTCLLWNRAAENIPGWPNLHVPIPNRSRRFALEWRDFPATFEADAEAYLTHLGTGDPFGNGDPFVDDYFVPAKPITVRHRRQQLLLLATALVNSGFPKERIVNLPVLVTPENAKRALRVLFDRAGRIKKEHLWGKALLIKAIARHWCNSSADELKALDDLCHGLSAKRHGMTQKNKERLRQLDDPANIDALLTLFDRILLEAGRTGCNGRREALRIMYAFVVQLLLRAPLRIKNLTSLEIDRHLLRSRPGAAGVVHLVIPAEEMKNGADYEIEFSHAMIDSLDVYLGRYHPWLADRSSTWLFPNPEGGRRSIGGFGAQISDFIFKETGLRMNPHLFRHVAAKLYLAAHPEDIETVRQLLGHKSTNTTLRAYVEFRNSKAFKVYDALIERLRQNAPVLRLRNRRSNAA